MNYESESFRNGAKVEGRYLNYFKVGHNNFEFVLDFDQFYLGSEEAEFCAQIVTNPIYTSKSHNLRFFAGPEHL